MAGGGMSTTLIPERVTAPARVRLPSARDDKLYFAQVREDPSIELAALDPHPGDRVVVVSSGGCTALSLLGAGAADVHAVDMNRTQNHLVDLKLAAVRVLSRAEAVAFLGGSPMAATTRWAHYATLRPHLTRSARDYWDAHWNDITRGVLDAGVSERFIALVAWTICHLVHDDDLIARLLACHTVEEQRALYDAEWNTRRWRWLFALLLNRWSMSRAYSPEFFANVGRRNFAEHFRKIAERTLAEVPIRENYFVHKMLTGRYPVAEEFGVPPYLAEPGFSIIASGEGRLQLVDGSMTDFLRTQPARSLNVFALSNVCEWLDTAAVRELFREVERTAAPGARVVFRNFVGWTELPAECSRLVQDRELGDAMIRSDRSGVQARVVVCRVQEDA